MKIAVLGTGVVGETIASKLIELGHQVRMGSRSASNEKGMAWVARHAEKASLGTFNDAAAFGEIIFNCTKGVEAIHILKSIVDKSLHSKILIDLTNPLDFSKGMPPTLSLSNTTSLGEEIQNNFPETFVVKTLNTMWCGLMVNPGMIGGGDHINFICGNDQQAKEKVKMILVEFGWMEQNIIDLGNISGARGTEMYLPLWLRIFTSSQNSAFNLKLVT
jgi:predicted dinucleotide-binding enzyme